MYQSEQCRVFTKIVPSLSVHNRDLAKPLSACPSENGSDYGDTTGLGGKKGTTFEGTPPNRFSTIENMFIIICRLLLARCTVKVLWWEVHHWGPLWSKSIVQHKVLWWRGPRGSNLRPSHGQSPLYVTKSSSSDTEQNSLSLFGMAFDTVDFSCFTPHGVLTLL